MSKQLLAFLVIFISFISFSVHYNRHTAKQQSQIICNMVFERIYQVTPQVKKWYRSCLQLQIKKSSPEYISQKLNQNFQSLNFSHLYIMNPEQSKWAWQGIKKEESGKWVEVDEAPRVIKLKNNQTVLKIPSFRGEYFTSKKWLQVVQKLKSTDRLYIDLRDNLGGNFVAMLRVLSSFFCKPTYIGKLINSNSGEGESVLTNKLDERVHSIPMADKEAVILKTFEGYGCLKPELHILVNRDTGSTSEILADSLQGLLNAKVYGPGTRGGVVLGMNYGIEFWPDGYSLSIPEALYINFQGQALEGVGLLMDQIEYPIDVSLL
ncbi:MAG: S41 family peptidase [Bdellovibrionales bacterium]|nr:S41 family peptidase [Bdellovibrionales bacterium]